MDLLSKLFLKHSPYFEVLSLFKSKVSYTLLECDLILSLVHFLFVVV